MRGWVVALILGLASTAFAQERWDHQGSISLLTGFGVEGRTSIGVRQADSGVRLFPELGATFPLSTRWHLKGAGRISLLGSTIGLSFLAGVRDGLPRGDLLAADVDHARLALRVEVGQRELRLARRGLRHGARR